MEGSQVILAVAYIQQMGNDKLYESEYQNCETDLTIVVSISWREDTVSDTTAVTEKQTRQETQDHNSNYVFMQKRDIGATNQISRRVFSRMHMFLQIVRRTDLYTFSTDLYTFST